MQSTKKRTARKFIKKMPTFVKLLILKTMSALKKRHGRVASAIILELAASVGSKNNPSGEIEVYGQVKVPMIAYIRLIPTP